MDTIQVRLQYVAFPIHSIHTYVLKMLIDGACTAFRGRHGSGAPADGGVRPRALVHVAARAPAWRPESVRAQRVPRGESAARSKCCDATGPTPAADRRHSCDLQRLIDCHARCSRECNAHSASKAQSRERCVTRLVPHILLVLRVRFRSRKIHSFFFLYYVVILVSINFTVWFS